MKLRWDPCVIQDAYEVNAFLSEYIDRVERRCLLIGGAGFDPRATLVPRKFAGLRKCDVVGIFFREERVLAQPKLRPRADATENEILGLLPQAQFPRVEIFSDGLTAVGGRRAVEAVSSIKFDQFTDIFVDISALSCGVFFSLVAYLIGLCDREKTRGVNLHLLTVEEPRFDHRILGVPSASATMLHGYRGDRSLDVGAEEPILWLPTLASGCRDSLSRIHQFIFRSTTPIDVCPIIPFPAQDTKLPDKLVAEFHEELTTWRVDYRNIFYAAESDPLDSYRAICHLCRSRDRLFRELGGSRAILSPLGNKMLSVGAMLAAIELRLPVAMVEALGYDEVSDAGTACSPIALKHVWLCGEAYGG